MNQPNKFAAPASSVDAEMPTKKKTGDYVLAGAILLQSLAMTLIAPLVFELVRTGAFSVVQGLGVVLSWALLLTGGIRLLVGRRRPRIVFAVSAALGLGVLLKLPMLAVVTGAVLAVIAFAASFLKPRV